MARDSISRRGILGGAAATTAFTLVNPLRPAGAAGEPLRIGALLPLTGAAGAYGPNMAKAAKVTAAYINETTGGVIDGRKIEVLVEDSESNPTAGVAAARKLLDVDKVSAVCGLWNSSVAMAIKPIVLERNMLFMVSGSADQITDGDNKGMIWRFQAKSSSWGGVIGRAMLAAGLKKVSVLGLQNPFTISMVGPFQEAMKKGGGAVTEVVYYNPSQSSYRAEVEKVFGRKPDGVFLPALLPDFTAIAKEVYRGGFRTKLFTLSIAGDSEGKFVKAVGPAVAEGINHLQPTPPIQARAYKKFLELMGEKEGRLFLFACNTFDQIAMTAMAAEKAKSTAPRAMAAQFASLANGPGVAVDDPAEGVKLVRAGKAVNYTGAGSSVDFDARGDLVNREFTHYRIKDGNNVVVNVVK